MMHKDTVLVPDRQTIPGGRWRGLPQHGSQLLFLKDQEHPIQTRKTPAELERELSPRAATL